MTNRRSLRNILKSLEQGPTCNHQPPLPKAPRPPRPQRYRQRHPNNTCWQSAIKIDLARRNADRKLQPIQRPSAPRTDARLKDNFKNLWDTQNISTNDLSISFKHPPVDRWFPKNGEVQQMNTLSSIQMPLVSFERIEADNIIDDSMDAEAPPHSERIRPDSQHSILLDFERTSETTSVIHQLTVDSETITFDVSSRTVTLCIQVMPSISIAPAVALLKSSPSKYMEICQVADNALVGSASMLYTTKFTGTRQIKKKAKVLETEMRRKRSATAELYRSDTFFSFPIIASKLPGDNDISSFIDCPGLVLNDIDDSMRSWMFQKEDDTVWPDTPKSQRQVAKNVKHGSSDDITMIGSILAKKTMVRFGRQYPEYYKFWNIVNS